MCIVCACMCVCSFRREEGGERVVGKSRRRRGKGGETFFTQDHNIGARKPVSFCDHELVINARRAVRVEVFLDDTPR